MEFLPFPSISRLNRDCVITEKLDGTNMQIVIEDLSLRIEAGIVLSADEAQFMIAQCGPFAIYAGSRNQFVSLTDDHYGFAKFVGDNAHDLIAKLGEGVHFGEWWGSGIGRGYGFKGKKGQAERFFSLFNTHRWEDPALRPSCCLVTPILYRGPFDTEQVNIQVERLREIGSSAVPGFMRPEGVVVFHVAANLCFKVTLNKDSMSKSQAEWEARQAA